MVWTYPSECNSLSFVGTLAYNQAQSPESEANLAPDLTRIKVPSYSSVPLLFTINICTRSKAAILVACGLISFARYFPTISVWWRTCQSILVCRDFFCPKGVKNELVTGKLARWTRMIRTCGLLDRRGSFDVWWGTDVSAHRIECPLHLRSQRNWNVQQVCSGLIRLVMSMVLMMVIYMSAPTRASMTLTLF